MWEKAKQRLPGLEAVASSTQSGYLLQVREASARSFLAVINDLTVPRDHPRKGVVVGER